jgi:hypothetical protein
MSDSRQIDFADRLSTAAKAKQALLEKARAKNPANDPEFAIRQAERIAASEARTARENERRAAKQAEREREAAEKAAAKAAAAEALAAQLAAEAAAREAERIEREVRAPLNEALAKLARDARYAARKSRKKG